MPVLTEDTVDPRSPSRREVMAGAVLAAAGLLLAACGGSAAAAAATVTADGVRRADPDAAALPGAATAVTGFAADLYRKAAATGSSNLVVSPFSAAVALAMARAGAAGRTAQEMDTVLHASETGPGPDALAVALNALAAHVTGLAGKRTRHDRSTAEVTLRVANALWGQNGLGWREEFLTTLARYYGAGMRVSDFQSKAADAIRQINSWVSEQTAKAIPNLVDAQSVDQSTRLVLVNALYFKAPWEDPFADPAPAPFTLADGTVVQAPRMRGGATRYASGPGWAAADIPYAGGEAAMAVIVPDAGSFAAVEAGLDGRTLRDLLVGGLQPAAVSLELPPWSWRSRTDLAEDLAALGMPTAFSDGADFSGMTTDAGLEIRHVVHEAYVAVDKEGTEAAAATAVAMAVSAVEVPGPVRTLVVDRPFLFVLHDTETGTPLFVGRVTDPTRTATRGG